MKEGFILVHSSKNVSSWSLISIATGPICGHTEHAGGEGCAEEPSGSFHGRQKHRGKQRRA